MKAKTLILCATALCTSALAIAQIEKPQEDTDTNLMENIDALSGVHEINDTVYIIDHVPCWSSAQERRSQILFWKRIYTDSYVDCASCKKMPGRGYGKEGQCTNIRKLNLHDNK